MDARSTAEDSEEVLEAAQLSSADQAIPATTRCRRPAVKLGSVIHSSDEGTGAFHLPTFGWRVETRGCFSISEGREAANWVSFDFNIAYSSR